GCFRISENMPVSRVGAERRSGAIGDIAEVTHQRAAMSFFDVRVGTLAGTNAVEEVGQVIGITTRARLRVDFTILHVVDDITSIADDHRTFGPVEADSKAGITRTER